jgi:hypothetical protein
MIGLRFRCGWVVGSLFFLGLIGVELASANTIDRNCPLPPRVPLPAGFGEVSCDLDGNGFCTCDDIDAMTTAVSSGLGSDEFDINGDGTVDAFDRDELIHEHFDTTYGDSNLDGQFDPSDFVAVFQAGLYQDQSGAFVSYCDGDWNGDGVFDSGDLVLAFQDGGFVPEPSSFSLILLAGLAIAGVRRRP